MVMENNQITERAFSIFMPFAKKKFDEAKESNQKFVQYTSAESASSIIQNKELWLRNTKCMNDYSEVLHGQKCLLDSYNNENGALSIKNVLDDIFPNFSKKFEVVFNGWLPQFSLSTYIACISEHDEDENVFGRLSMWRAYGGECSVAIVVNSEVLTSENDELGAYTYPVSYLDGNEFNVEFQKLIDRISINKEFFLEFGEEFLKTYLFETFKWFVLCTKHPGFKEEREWRIVYNPELKKSQYIKSSLKTISGIPQIIQSLPLKDIADAEFYGANISDIVSRIILGPNDHQLVLAETFTKLLDEAGCKDSRDKIFMSGIPLR